MPVVLVDWLHSWLAGLVKDIKTKYAVRPTKHPTLKCSPSADFN